MHVPQALGEAVQRKTPRYSARSFEKSAWGGSDPKPVIERENPSTLPELHQPLLFAPAELLRCGLRAAHPFPFVGTRTAAGVRSWRTTPARAWAWPLVEWSRTGNSYAALGFDCDSREAVERAAACAMSAGDLPTPNVVATRTASGHAQIFYLLDRPVHRGEQARDKPLTYLARVSEYYRASLGADAGYRGVLSSNPIHGDYQTSYPRTDPYALADLARVIPKGWRITRPATTPEGRNCTLFRALCRRGLRDTDRQLDAWADRYNGGFSAPMDANEVRDTVRSVHVYRRRWRREGHKPSWLRQQSFLGVRGGTASGVVRRAGSLAERQPWAALGVSRATWYRRFGGAKAAGESMGEGRETRSLYR